MLKILRSSILATALSACSTIPNAPSVLVLPGTGMNFDQFHVDDGTCKQFAQKQIAAAPAPPDSREEGQQQYDIAYVQCMYGKDHRVPVPGELLFDTRQEWHPPPPPNLPPPSSTTEPESSMPTSR